MRANEHLITRMENRARRLPKPIKRLGKPAFDAYWQLLWDIAPEMMLERDDPAMRALCAETNIAFVHIPKNGGTSIANYIYGHDVSHRPITWFHQYEPYAVRKWFKFAVIREPIDRFLSAFDYLKTDGRNFTDRRFRRRFIGKRDVNRFISDLAQRPRVRRNVLTYFHFRPQIEYVLVGGEISVDRLIRFDAIADELPKILGRSDPLPRLNSTTGARTPRESLSVTSLDILHDLYRQDFDLWRRAIASSNTAASCATRTD